MSKTSLLLVHINILPRSRVLDPGIRALLIVKDRNLMQTSWKKKGVCSLPFLGRPQHDYTWGSNFTLKRMSPFISLALLSLCWLYSHTSSRLTCSFVFLTSQEEKCHLSSHIHLSPSKKSLNGPSHTSTHGLPPGPPTNLRPWDLQGRDAQGPFVGIPTQTKSGEAGVLKDSDKEQTDIHYLALLQVWYGDQATCKNSWEMQIPRLHSRWTDSVFLGVEPSNLCFKKPSRGFYAH